MDKIEMDGIRAQENERFWAILRMIHDSSPVGIYVVDLQGGRIRFFNDAFLRIWGLEHLKTRLCSGDLIEAELIRQMITKAIDGPALEKALYHLGKGAMDAPAAEVIQLSNGRTVKCRSSGIRKETITPPYHIYIFDDVTEVVTAREEAVKSSVRYKELVDLLPQIVFEIDLAGNLTFVNQSAFSVMGYTEADLLRGMNVLERVVPEDRERVMQNMQRVLNGRKSGHEYTFMHKDGSRFPVIIHSSVIYQEGMPVGFRGIIFDITEQKNTENRLRTLSAAIEQSPSSVMISDIGGKIVYVNPRFSLITGVQPEEAQGHSLLELSFANAKPGQLSEVEKVIGSGQSWRGEIEYVKKSGKPSWVAAYIFPIRDDFGAITHYIEVEEDITERKLAEGEHHKLLLALDQNPNSITIADSKGMITYVNSSFSRMTGIRSEDVIGKYKMDFSPSSNQERVKSIMNMVITGEEWKSERTFTRKDGLEGCVSVQISPIKDPDGKVGHFLIVEADITERKQTEDQLRKLSAAVEQSPAGVKIVDEKGEIIYVNPRFLEMSGYDQAEVIGRPIAEMPGSSIDDKKEQIHNAIGTGKDWYGEIQYKKKSGEQFWAESHMSPIKDDSGAIKSYIEITEDITERKLSEERLKESLHEKEVLLKEVHHRVKNNMQIISSLLHLQLSGIDQEPVRQILTESQNRIKSIALVHERIYMSDDLARIDFKEYMKSLSAQLLYSYSTSMRLVNLTVVGDPIHLGVDQAVPCGLIMNELVSNSLKHAFPGYRGGTIKIHLRDGSTNQIIIEDDGVGMPENFCLTQVQSMGMQLVAALVDQLDGTITLDRSDGTRFTITFPVR